MNVPLSCPDISQREIDYVNRVLTTNVLSIGPVQREFEEKFAAYVGTRYAVAVSSGTAALHLCVRALGIGSQDEVLTTSFSFVASANCLRYEGALPLFVDIDSETLNIDPEVIREFIRRHCEFDRNSASLIDKRTGRRVKAILPVHVFGLPCDMNAILEIAHEYGMYIIEDACEAIGAEYRGWRVGGFGEVAAFAFYPNKQMTTAEGGMVVTNDEKVARLCRSMRNQGRGDDPSWLEHVRLGYNYRLSELHCALGLAQLERIEELLTAREKAAAAYTQELSGHPLIVPPHAAAEPKRSWFVYVVQVNGPSLLRDRILIRLREHGIGCQAYFPAVHRQPYFGESDLKYQQPLPRTERAAGRCLALPFFSRITKEQIDFVCNTLLEVVEEESATQLLESVPFR
jgi:perosamine synthetase